MLVFFFVSLIVCFFGGAGDAAVESAVVVVAFVALDLVVLQLILLLHEVCFVVGVLWRGDSYFWVGFFSLVLFSNLVDCFLALLVKQF